MQEGETKKIKGGCRWIRPGPGKNKGEENMAVGLSDRFNVRTIEIAVEGVEEEIY